MVERLLQSSDILCLQEIWLWKQDLGSLHCLSDGCHGIGEATRDGQDGTIQGHPPGGVAIFWRLEYEEYITELKFEQDWIVGIQLCQDNNKLAILCIYLPYQCTDNEEEYLTKLGQLSAVIDDIDTTCITVIGDFNADAAGADSCFWNHLRQFCLDNNLTISTVTMLPDDSFTYVSDSWYTVYLAGSLYMHGRC